MDALEMAVFVVLVAGSVLAIAGGAWFIQWKRDPGRFKTWMRRDPADRSGPFKR